MACPLFTDHLRLRGMEETPPAGRTISAQIICVDDMNPDDPIVHLAREPYIHQDGAWFGEITGANLPRGAKWWLPETELCAVPQAVEKARAVAGVA
jgi:hypothetical protein